MRIQSKLMMMVRKQIYFGNMVKTLSRLLMKIVPNWRMNSANDSFVNREKYYLTIDELPLWNWIKIMDGELHFIRKNVLDGNEIADVEIYDELFDQYISDFGLSKIHQKLLLAQKKRAMLELDFVITGNRFKLTEIDMQIVKIENMLKNAGSGMTIEQSLIHISKWMNSWINAKSISTREFFILTKEFERINKMETTAPKNAIKTN